MSFTPILTSQYISYAEGNTNYRNSYRETIAGGTPVFFVPSDLGDGYGLPGPKYAYGYTYYNSTATNLGNCTWWCYGRCEDANGVKLTDYGIQNQDAKNWYSLYTGNKDIDATNANAGDIIVYTDSDAGHVMFIESIVNDVLYISHSAYSTRSVWSGMSCLVGNYDRSDIIAGNSINIYKDAGTSAYNVTVVGVLHTGDTPVPPVGPTETEIAIYAKITGGKRKNVKLIL